MKHLTDQEHNLAIGSIVTAAANADLVLFNSFWRISKTNLHVASCIYYSIEAMPVKTRIITKIAKYECNYNQRKLIKEVITAASKANENRKEVAHSSRINVASKVFAANPRNIKNPATPITAAAFNKLIIETAGHLRAAEAAHQKLCESLGVSPQLQIAHDTD